ELEAEVDSGPASAAQRLPALVGAKAASVPAQQSLRLYDDHSVQRRREQSTQPDQAKTVQVPQPNALSSASEYQHRLAQDISASRDARISNADRNASKLRMSYTTITRCS